MCSIIYKLSLFGWLLAQLRLLRTMPCKGSPGFSGARDVCFETRFLCSPGCLEFTVDQNSICLLSAVIKGMCQHCPLRTAEGGQLLLSVGGRESCPRQQDQLVLL